MIFTSPIRVVQMPHHRGRTRQDVAGQIRVPRGPGTWLIHFGPCPPALVMMQKRSTCSHAITPKHICGKRRATSLATVAGPMLRDSELPHVPLPQTSDRLHNLDHRLEQPDAARQPRRLRAPHLAITACSSLVGHHDRSRTSSVSGWSVPCVSRMKDRRGRVSWPWSRWPGRCAFSTCPSSRGEAAGL